jgi:hypothetical protein
MSVLDIDRNMRVKLKSGDPSNTYVVLDGEIYDEDGRRHVVVQMHPVQIGFPIGNHRFIDVFPYDSLTLAE